MIDANTRQLVRNRADNQCEYCGIHQDVEAFVNFQIEHIIAIQHGGGDENENLALACSHCNLHKGPNLAGIDPVTNQIVPLFHPRRQSWTEDFEYVGAQIMGLTPCGRATVRVLAMNAQVRVELRQEELRDREDG